ncbi:MAG: thermonuclease family protein [Patescibacteria group bacterium]|jgi:endonuclease YncB( thermonuclease family)
MKKFFLPFLGLIALFLGLNNLNLRQEIQKLTAQNKVIEVIDGDSLTLASKQRVRLANLDAPELEFCGGIEAKNKLESLTLNKTVRLEIIGHDNLNRSISLVYVDNTLVNEIVLKEGWARYDGSPSPEKEKLKQAYDYAFENRLGIFSPLCFSEEPPSPKCLIKGNVDRHYGQKTYHFPGCSGYPQVMVEKDLGEDWFCSEKEAEKAGFTKSKNCYGKIYVPI